MWVPSYIGIACNEMANKYADIATKTILHPTITDIQDKDINKSIRNKNGKVTGIPFHFPTN